MSKHLLFVSGGIIAVLFCIMLVYVTNDPTTQTTNTRSSAREPQANSNQPVQNQETDPNKITSKSSLPVGFPLFPVYPGAKLEESVKMVQATNTQGYHAIWTIEELQDVSAVMKWYIEELKNMGWDITQYPIDPNQSEQIIKIKKGGARATLDVEIEGKEGIQIFVDFPLVYEE